MNPFLIRTIPVVLALFGIAYVIWQLTPPREVIGQRLLDTHARRRDLLRAEQAQAEEDGRHL